MKVQNEMSTRISVDTMSAVKNMSDFRNAISAVGNSWRAEERMLKDSGNTSEAVRARINGLNQVIDLQKAKIGELRQRQEGLDTSNQKQASQFFKLERQISQANKQLVNYQSQEEKARQNSLYYVSGLADLQKQYRLNDAVSKSFASSLRAQGKDIEADQQELKGLQESLSSLEKQQTKQEFLLKQVAHSSGETSEAYKKQVIQLNKTKEAIVNTKTKMDELNRSLNPPRISGWQLIRTDILHVDEAEQRARDHAISFGTALKTGILGGWVQQGFSSLAGEMKSVITNGMQVAKVGAAMEARWKNIGVSASGIKQLSAQVTELKTNTNLSAQAVNALQTRFYGMTHSVSQTTALTKGVASLADQLKLSDKQADAFAGGLSRIESSGKVASSSLGRLEKQAPGLTAAMSKASGMSQQAFKNLVSSGKMTSDQFNQILVKASKDYDANAKAFGQSSGGALHRLQQQWTTTQATLAKPLLKVSATGLNELNSALNNKDTQRGLQVLAKGLADAAVNAAKFIGYIAKHQTTVKAFALAVTGLFVAFKGVQTTVIAVDTLKSFIDIMGKAKQITVFSTAIKGIGTAAKIATLGFNPWVIAIEAVAAGFTLLYKHSKKFRNFVNGLANDAKKGMKAVGKWFSSTFKSIAKAHQQSVKQQQRQNKINQRNWNNFTRAVSKTVTNAWKTIQRNSSNGWHSIERNAQRGTSRVGRWYQQLSKNTQRTITNMARNHPRTFGNMYRLIQDRTRVWHDVVSGHWSDLGRDTGRLASDASRTNRSIFKSMYDDINDKTDGGLGRVVSSWQSHMSSIGDAIKSAAKHAAQAMADLANLVLKPFKILIDDIQGGINWILDKVGASKLGGSWSAAIPTFATGTAGNADGLKKSTIGMVNDGAGSHWREMYSYKGHVGMFPNKRNFITYLPKGMSILNGEDSHKLMNMMGLPHFANGIGDFFSGILSKSEDILENVDKILEHPIEFAKSVFEKFTSHIHTNIKFAASLVKNVPSYIAKQIGNWIKKQFATLENPGGAGVARWRPYIIRAFKQLGVEPAEWKVAKLLRQIQTESGGNPLAWQGIHDYNSGGNEARGLLQFAGSTWAADALPGHKDWRNGYNEILAAIAVLERGGEGGWGNVGNGHGWANGGLISTHGMYEVGEGNKPEMIIPLSASKRSRAYQLLSEVMAQFKHEDNNGSETHSSGGLYDKQDFVNVQRLIDELNNGIKTLISLQQTQIAVTKAQGKFDPHQQYIQQAQALSMKLQQY